MYFTSKGKVNYYDCDMHNRLKISAALRYMQQTSSEHLEHLGYPYEKLLAENMVFLLSKMCVKVHRMPEASSPIVIGTAPTMTRGARFVREFIIESPDGERLVSALSLWMLVDPTSRKVLRPSSFPYQLPFKSSILDGAIDDIRIPKLLEEGKRMLTEIPIRYSHIDSNNHVNNSCYADFACDAVPFDQLLERGIDTLVLSFLNEAKWGDKLQISTSILSGDEYFLTGAHGDSSCFEALVKLGQAPADGALVTQG